jgi:hypothetical protein
VQIYSRGFNASNGLTMPDQVNPRTDGLSLNIIVSKIPPCLGINSKVEYPPCIKAISLSDFEVGDWIDINYVCRS